MTTNTEEGLLHQAIGSAKETFGKVTGKTGTQLSGAAEKNAGKMQTAIGKLGEKLS